MNHIVRFDKHVTVAVQQLPAWLAPIMKAGTFSGNLFPVFTSLSLVYLLGTPIIKVVVVFISLTIILNAVLKQFIHRPRPDTLYVSRMRFKTHSFPSGHAFGTITTYGFISYLAAANLVGLVGYASVLLLWILIGLVGVSRVYLGAHYPTDVIGGWILGTICLSVAILMA